MLRISQLYIYPVKSLGGISLTTATLTDRGLEHDRRWMLIDSSDRFLSQREHPQMALLKTALLDEGIRVTYATDGSSIMIPFGLYNEERLSVTVWDDTCDAALVDRKIDDWFSEKLKLDCRLVYMPDDSLRQTDLRYTNEGTVTSFSDAYPILIIGQASLDDLNSRLDQPLPMDRFRPNIVFTGGEPYCEDGMKEVRVGDINLFGVKLCARCVMTTIDQQTAAKGKEPLKTLARYRGRDNKILFGQNLVHNGTGVISVGDELLVTATHTDERFIVKP